MKKTILTTALAGALTLSSQAAITILNADFDNTAVTDGGFVGNVSSWTGSGNFGTANPGATITQPTSGDNVAYLFSTSQVNNASLSQDVGVTADINAGDTITFTFDAWRNNGTGNLTLNFAGIGAQAVDLGTGENDVTSNSITFTATSTIAAGTQGLTFNHSGVVAQHRIDSIRAVVTAVPEPSSTALLGLSGLALILRRRK